MMAAIRRTQVDDGRGFLVTPFGVTLKGVIEGEPYGGTAALYSESLRPEHRLGAASTVQKALASLESQDVIGRYEDAYFFLDPLFAA
ncbi:MAG: hypothetical protein ACRD06_09815 [Terriglobia bacterium]